ncbi:hypothetical protein ACIFQM_11300 [Paenibacillus sp. NRS-1782]|uniref:hypothetical protein n=1 Tax=unclassified Paenibacillus TaxID=185978 RepID=UPI003D2BE51D
MNIYYLRFTEDNISVGCRVTVKAANREQAILRGFKRLSRREQDAIDFCDVTEDASNK